MAILVFMFVFSFIGGLISPYEQDKFFYADKTIRREFAAVIKNTEFRYSSGGRFRVRPACSGAGYAGHPTAEGRLYLP